MGALLKSWLMSQPEECYANLENWLGDYFQQALDWVLKQVTVILLDLDPSPLSLHALMSVFFPGCQRKSLDVALLTQKHFVFVGIIDSTSYDHSCSVFES